MKFLLLLLLAFDVHAATYYRYVPGGVCMVDFYGRSVNASMIERLSAGTFTDLNLLSRPEYIAVRLWLVTGYSPEARTATLAEAEQKKQAFLTLLKEQCP